MPTLEVGHLNLDDGEKEVPAIGVVAVHLEPTVNQHVLKILAEESHLRRRPARQLGRPRHRDVNHAQSTIRLIVDVGMVEAKLHHITKRLRHQLVQNLEQLLLGFHCDQYRGEL